MATIEQYDGGLFPYVLMGTGGTAGDIIYLSTGSGLTYKSASTGTGVSGAVIGILVDNTAKGSYGAVNCEGIAQLQKHAATQVIEVGDRIAGTKSSNKVGTVLKGTAWGICAKQSASTDTYVSVKLLPFYITGAGGYHA